MSTYASRLKYALAKAAVSQKDLSERTGISRTAISQYLSGKYTPSRDRANRLAEVLGVSTGYLDGTEEPNSEVVNLVRMRIGIATAARCLGKADQFVRVGLQTGQLPFGSAVLNPSGQWSYYINPIKFRAYVTPEVFDQYFGQKGA